MSDDRRISIRLGPDLEAAAQLAAQVERTTLSEIGRQLYAGWIEGVVEKVNEPRVDVGTPAPHWASRGARRS